MEYSTKIKDDPARYMANSSSLLMSPQHRLARTSLGHPTSRTLADDALRTPLRPSESTAREPDRGFGLAMLDCFWTYEVPRSEEDGGGDGLGGDGLGGPAENDKGRGTLGGGEREQGESSCSGEGDRRGAITCRRRRAERKRSRSSVSEAVRERRAGTG